MSEFYTEEHVIYDEFETALTLHCLRCHAVIARRAAVPTQEKNVMVHGVIKGANYREVYAELNDGSVCYFPMCQDCVKQPIDGAAALDVVKRGWIAALRHHGRPQEAIDSQQEKVANLAVTKVGRKE